MITFANWMANNKKTEVLLYMLYILYTLYPLYFKIPFEFCIFTCLSYSKPQNKTTQVIFKCTQIGELLF